jgi:hypothetical protein
MPSVSMPRSRASCPAAPISDVAAPCRRAGHRDLVNQQNAAAAESGIAGPPYDRDVTHDAGTVGGDQARAVRFRVVGQVRPRLGLAIAHPLEDERPG